MTRWRLAASLAAGAALVAAAAGVAAFAPLSSRSREVEYVIPRGTAARQAAGESTYVFPPRLTFTIGVRDVLVLRNEDVVPASFGPLLLLPGQTYRLPFHAPGEFQLACSVHVGGDVGISVQGEPTPGWPRLRWRVVQGLES